MWRLAIGPCASPRSQAVNKAAADGVRAQPGLRVALHKAPNLYPCDPICALIHGRRWTYLETSGCLLHIMEKFNPHMHGIVVLSVAELYRLWMA